MSRPQHNEEKPTILVAGVGNIFLSDDGFGPEVVRHLAGESQPLPPQARLVDYGIRGMHLAYDLLEGYAALVLIRDPGQPVSWSSWRSGRMMSPAENSTLTGWIRSPYWRRCQTSAGSSHRPIWWAADRPSLAKESA